jgi:hypothetical protein
MYYVKSLIVKPINIKNILNCYFFCEYAFLRITEYMDHVVQLIVLRDEILCYFRVWAISRLYVQHKKYLFSGEICAAPGF